ncbi:hypothetical protein BJ956_000646 [Arthrobacter psychrochitiniphilus]|nr:hypothetical protein [Arthrobacter psychrochitiniphilus]
MLAGVSSLSLEFSPTFNFRMIEDHVLPSCRPAVLPSAPIPPQRKRWPSFTGAHPRRVSVHLLRVFKVRNVVKNQPDVAGT